MRNLPNSTNQPPYRGPNPIKSQGLNNQESHKKYRFSHLREHLAWKARNPLFLCVRLHQEECFQVLNL